MGTGFTTHTHNVLKAVETGAPRVMNRLAVVFIEIYTILASVSALLHNSLLICI